MAEEKTPLLGVREDPESVYVNVTHTGAPLSDHTYAQEKTETKFADRVSTSDSIEIKPNPLYEPYDGPVVTDYASVGARYRARQTSSVADVTIPITISWKDVNVYATPQNRGFCRGPPPGAEPKHILRNVSGVVKPGTLLAILGSSGAGKSTLMNVLTFRNQTKNLVVQGDVRVNGVDIGKDIRNVSAYLQQDDLFIGTLTVREHLTFRALLRMDKRIGTQDRLKKVAEVMQELGLSKCAHTVIGTPGGVKGISGGERKRLAFASEVLTNPPLIFCDEPTSGLDSYMAKNIVQALKLLVSNGRTIITTLHQPASEVFEMFDQLLLLSEGRVAYLGPASEATDFFASVNFNCPFKYNPADYFIATLAIQPDDVAECRRKVEIICDSFEDTNTYKILMTENEELSKSSNVGYNVNVMADASRYGATWYTQFRNVLWRSWVTNWRDPMMFKAKILQSILSAVVLGLIYLKTNDVYNQNDVQNISGILIVMLMQISMLNIFPVLTTFPMELPIFLREYGSGLYGVDVYFLSQNVAELPSFIVFPFIFSTILYWMSGLFHAVNSYFILCGIIIFIANISASFGYMVSTAFSSVGVALVVAPAILMPLLLFGGFFVNNNTVGDWLIWIKYISWFQFANELLSVNQWKDVDVIYCGNVTESNPPIGSASCSSGAAVLAGYDFTNDNLLLDLVMLTALLVGFRVISFLMLFYKAKQSKS